MLFRQVAPCGHSEQALAARLLPGMLVLADRNCHGFQLWQSASAAPGRRCA